MTVFNFALGSTFGRKRLWERAMQGLGFGKPLFLVMLLMTGLTNGAALAQTTAILVPGAGGAIPIDFVVRNQTSIQSAGFRTIITVTSEEIVAAANAIKQGGGKAVIVAMSRGTQATAQALSGGARVDGVVFVSGEHLGRVSTRLGSPAKLPPTLVIHNQNDTCASTLPETATQFVTWSAGRGRLVWVNEAGPEVRNPCGPVGAHGFYQRDTAVVSAIVAFLRSR